MSYVNRGRLMRALDRAGIEHSDLFGCEWSRACEVILQRLRDRGFDGEIVMSVTSLPNAVRMIDEWNARRVRA